MNCCSPCDANDANESGLSLDIVPVAIPPPPPLLHPSHSFSAKGPLEFVLNQISIGMPVRWIIETLKSVMSEHRLPECRYRPRIFLLMGHNQQVCTQLYMALLQTAQKYCADQVIVHLTNEPVRFVSQIPASTPTVPKIHFKEEKEHRLAVAHDTIAPEDILIAHIQLNTNDNAAMMHEHIIRPQNAVMYAIISIQQPILFSDRYQISCENKHWLKELGLYTRS